MAKTKKKYPKKRNPESKKINEETKRSLPGVLAVENIIMVGLNLLSFLGFFILTKLKLTGSLLGLAMFFSWLFRITIPLALILLAALTVVLIVYSVKKIKVRVPLMAAAYICDVVFIIAVIFLIALYNTLTKLTAV